MPSARLDIRRQRGRGDDAAQRRRRPRRHAPNLRRNRSTQDFRGLAGRPAPWPRPRPSARRANGELPLGAIATSRTAAAAAGAAAGLRSLSIRAHTLGRHRDDCREHPRLLLLLRDLRHAHVALHRRQPSQATVECIQRGVARGIGIPSRMLSTVDRSCICRPLSSRVLVSQLFPFLSSVCSYGHRRCLHGVPLSLSTLERAVVHLGCPLFACPCVCQCTVGRVA